MHVFNYLYVMYVCMYVCMLFIECDANKDNYNVPVIFNSQA